MSELDVKQFAAAQADGAFVVDVREPVEYLAGHVPGAVLVPVAQVPTRIAELPEGERTYVICASGNRSRAVRDYLRTAGLDAWTVNGGTNAWVSSGRPVVTGPHANAAA
jgi:rhodanese-related sulfurtransferase